MMNSIRSTEKSLRLLKNACKVKSSRPIQTRSFDVYLKSKPSKSFLVKRGPGTIKLQQVSLIKRPLTTKQEPIELPSLLNPNKAPPTSLKDLVPKPIVPLSHSKFLKQVSGESAAPSVTRVLSATMPASSQYILDRWKEAMIKKLGVEGFNKYQQDTFERGRALHAVLAKHLMGFGEPTVELSKEIVANLWKSIQNVVKDQISNVRLVEHAVTHTKMNYRGIVDCVAFYRDELVVIDFKTAEKPKKTVESLYDNPLQVTAYCGAINNDLSIPLDVIDRNIASGLVIVAYCDGSEASVYYLNSDTVANDYWVKWNNRLNQYSQMESLKHDQKGSSNSK